MVKFLIILSVLTAMSTTSSNLQLQIQINSDAGGSTHSQADNLIFPQSLLSVWVKYHNHGLKKRQINGSNKIDSLFCGKRTSTCKYFYPDHPDAGSFRIKGHYNQTNITKNGIREAKQIDIYSNHTFTRICEDTSSFCTYYHPDHTNAGQHSKRINGNYSTTTTVVVKGIYNRIMKQNESNNTTIHLPICEDISSSFCTYLYLDHSIAGHRLKSNYTPTIRTDIIDDKMLKDSKQEDFTRLCLQNTVKRNLPNCGGSDQFCIYFYPDHPDADPSIKNGHSTQTNNNKINHGTNEQKTLASNHTPLPSREDTSSFCTYFHPDHPDTGRVKKVIQGQTSIINETNGISQQQTIDQNESLHIIKPTCKDSSSFCTFNFANSDAFHEKKSNYTPTIATRIDTMLNDTSNKVANISVEEHFTSSPNINTKLSVNPTSPSTFSVSISDDSPKSTTGVENISFRGYFTNSLPTISTSLSVNPTSSSTSAASISNNSSKSTTGVSNISGEEYLTSLPNIITKLSVEPTSPSTSAISISNNSLESTTAEVADIFVEEKITSIFPNISTKLIANSTSPPTSAVFTKTSTKEVLNISVNAAYFTNLPGASTSLSVRPTSSSFSAVPSSLESPKSTTSTAVTHTSNGKYLRKLCNHQKLDVLIRNTKTKEFFYAASDGFSLDERRRRVFTWKNVYDIPGISDEWSGEEIWRFEPINQHSSRSFRLRNTKPVFGPKEYLFVSKSDSGVYVRRGLPNDDSAVLKLGSSAKWQLLAKTAGNAELREDFCDIDMSEVSGWVLRNEMNAGYLKTKTDDATNVMLDPTGVRRNVGLSTGNFTFWDILPLSSYRPIPAPPRKWKNDQEGTIKWDMKCDFKGNDIGGFLKTPSDLKCMDQCKRNSKCTHWTYNTSQRKCYLKKADQMTEGYNFEINCGFIPGRSRQKYTE